MNAMIIADLNQSQDLDRKALAAVAGGLATKCVTGRHFKKVELVTLSFISDSADAIIKAVGDALTSAARSQ